MSDIFSIFNNGHEHLSRERDLRKVLALTADQGGPGSRRHDLDSGVIELPNSVSPPPSGHSATT